MRIFEDYQKNIILLSDTSWEHIKEEHGEVTLEIIKQTLSDPEEIRQSSSEINSVLYYSIKSLLIDKKRYWCIVVKRLLDNRYFIKTAMVTSRLKEGIIIYQKKGEEL